MENVRSITLLLALSAGTVAGMPALGGEFEFSVYGGVQTGSHSRVEGDDPAGIGPFSFSAGWNGESFDPAPYYLSLIHI